MTTDFYAAGTVGAYGGVPVFDSNILPRGEYMLAMDPAITHMTSPMIVRGTREPTLREQVRMDLRNYIRRRVREVSHRLGLT